MKPVLYQDACATMLRCLLSVLWIKVSVRGTSEKLSAAPRPKNNTLAFISPHNIVFICICVVFIHKTLWFVYKIVLKPLWQHTESDDSIHNL